MYLTIDGRQLSYLQHVPPRRPEDGQRTLVLLHAFPLSADMWAPQLASPPPGWQVVAPDLRGFGESDADSDVSPTAGLTLDDYARDVLALLEHLQVRDAVVGGLSLGGYVVFALLRLLGGAGQASLGARGAPPPRARDPLDLLYSPGIAGLVLADTRPQADSDEGRGARLRMAEMVDREGATGLARAIIPKLVDEATARRRPAAVESVRQMILTARPEAIKGALYRMMNRPDSTDQLAGITHPTLIIVGEGDTLTPPEVSRDMHARIPGASLAVLPESGHIANLEQPETFGRALDHFLDRI
jgi:pimeloyl-ACP methyl ester carboxylesterase